LDALFSFGGGNPFLASIPASAVDSVTKTASPSAKAVSGPSKDAPARNGNPANVKTAGTAKAASPSTKTAPVRTFDPATTKGPLLPTPCIPPAPTPCPPTPTPTPGCGPLVGSGLTLGFPPHNYTTLASNTVNYTFDRSQPAPNEFAIFETHNPWSGTIIKDAITASGHTYTEFAPAQLDGFDFSQYRVVILNWDDTFLFDFFCDYSAALPALEAYAAAGGVVWVQGAIQTFTGTDCYPLPFGGQACTDFGFSDPIVDACNPMVIGVEDPIEGNAASHVSQTGLPDDAHVVVVNEFDNNSVLYDLACATPQPTPTLTPPLCNTGLIHNGGFETGNLTTWVIDGVSPSPVVTNALSHSGRFSTFAGGDPPQQFCGIAIFGGPGGDSSFYQEFGPVPAGATLNFWHWDCNFGSIDFAWQDAYIADTDGNILLTIFHQGANTQCWVNEAVDLSPWVGQTIRVKFLVHQDGFGNLIGMYVDDVGVFVSGPCASPTPRPTPTPRPRSTPHPRP
jgi:hypothetical protein